MTESLTKDLSPAEAPDQRFSAGYKNWFLFLMFSVSMVNFIDRFAFFTLAQAIKQDLKISDLQLGILSGFAFAVLYSLLGLPIARLSERRSRIAIISVAVALWSVMTAACGMVQNFVQLALTRVGVGIGEAGFLPPVTSLISDHFPPNRRATAYAIVTIGQPVGVLFGAIAGGYMADYLNWRLAFFIVGLPGVLLALLTFFTLREPPRGLSDGPVAIQEEPPSIWAVLKILFAKPTFRHLALAISLAGFGGAAIGTFHHPFYVRVFHLSFAEAGVFVGLMAGSSISLGLAIGGFGADFASKRDLRWYAWVPAIGTALAAPAYVAAFDIKSLWWTTVLMLIGGMMLGFGTSPAAAMTQNMAGPRMRASTAFIIAFIGSLIGTGLGPTVAGFLSDLFAARAFRLGAYAQMCPGGVPPANAAPELATACENASSSGISAALLIVSIFFLWSAVHYVLASRTLKRDLDPGTAAALARAAK